MRSKSISDFSGTVFDRECGCDWDLKNGILVEKPERKVMSNREPGICFTYAVLRVHINGKLLAGVTVN